MEIYKLLLWTVGSLGMTSFWETDRLGCLNQTSKSVKKSKVGQKIAPAEKQGFPLDKVTLCSVLCHPSRWEFRRWHLADSKVCHLPYARVLNPTVRLLGWAADSAWDLSCFCNVDGDIKSEDDWRGKGKTTRLKKERLETSFKVFIFNLLICLASSPNVAPFGLLPFLLSLPAFPVSSAPASTTEITGEAREMHWLLAALYVHWRVNSS